MAPTFYELLLCAEVHHVDHSAIQSLLLVYLQL